MLDPNFMMLQRKGDHEQDEYQFLVNMEAAVEALMAQSKVIKALECASHVLSLRKDFYGDDSEEFVMYLKNLSKRTFQAAVQCLEANDQKQALTALKLLEEMLTSQGEIAAFITEICELYNQLACSYKRLDKPRLTKSYLEKALHLSRTYKEAPIDRASLHLNMCAVLSALSKHKDAVKFGASAVQYAQEELVNLKLAGETETSQKVTMLAVSYHNLAVEEEHLRNYDAALDWYNKAVNFMEAHGSHSSLLDEFKKSAAAAYKAFQKSKRQGGPIRPSSATNPRMANDGLKRTLQRIKKQVHTDTSSASSSGLRISDREYLRGSGSVFTNTLKRSSSPVRYANSVGFDTRFPIAVKPPNFDAFRMQQRKRKISNPRSPKTQLRGHIAAVVADHSVYSQANRMSDQMDSETEAELRELETMGLLEYSMHESQPQAPPRIPQEVRRNPPKAAMTRDHFKSSNDSVKGLTRSQLSEPSLPKITPARADSLHDDVRLPTPRNRAVDTRQYAHISKKKPEVHYSSQSSSSSSSSSKSFKALAVDPALEQAAVKLQAAIRGWKVRREIDLKKMKLTKLVKFRGGVKLSRTVFAIVTVTERKHRLKIQAESEGKKWRLRIDAKQAAYRLPPSELVAKLIVNERNQLVLRPDKPAEEPAKPVVSPAPKPATARNLLRGASQEIVPTAMTENLTVPYAVVGNPNLPIKILREGAKLTVSYVSGDQTHAVQLRDNLQGLSSPQAKAYIEQNVCPAFSISEGQLRYNSKVLGPVQQKEDFDLSQYDPDKVAFIQNKVDSM